MYGELTDKETVGRLEFSLEAQQQDQFEVLLYKKNSEYLGINKRTTSTTTTTTSNSIPHVMHLANQRANHVPSYIPPFRYGLSDFC